MMILLRHYLFGHFRMFVCCLSAAIGATLVVLTTDNHDMWLFAGGVEVTWTALAIAGAVVGVVETIQCRRNMQAIDDAMEPTTVLQRETDLSGAPPALVQRMDNGFRITWISSDNTRSFGVMMSTDHAHELASKLHEGLYG